MRLYHTSFGWSLTFLPSPLKSRPALHYGLWREVGWWRRTERVKSATGARRTCWGVIKGMCAGSGRACLKAQEQLKSWFGE